MAFKNLPACFRSGAATVAAPSPLMKGLTMATTTVVAADNKNAPAPTPAEGVPSAPPATPPAPPATPPVTPVALTGAEIQAKVNDGISLERKRVANITALCDKAGCRDRAQQWIDNGTSVDMVQAALFDVLCAARPTVGGDTGASMQNGASGDEAYKREYQSQREIYLSRGITEEAYLQSRRFDDGAPLQAGFLNRQSPQDRQ